MKSKKQTPKKTAKSATKKPSAKQAAKKEDIPFKATVTKYEADKVYELPLTKVIAGDNYRKNIDTAGIKELANSILHNGLIQPITVRPSAKEQGMFEVIAGERRLLAHREAKLKTIRALVQLTDDEQTRVLQLIENLQRVDVHPMDESLAFFDLTRKKEGQKKADFTAESLGAAIGKSKSYIFKRIKLRELETNCQTAFRNDLISYNHALLLSRLQPAVQSEALLWLNESNNTKTVEQLRDYLQEELFIDISEAPFDLLEPKLVTGCLACIECPKRTINNTDFPTPEGWDENEPYDKCTDKNCFFRKVDAHREQAIKDNTIDGKPPLLGKVSYSFDSQIKVGPVTHLFSKKKTAEHEVPVVITKQTNGKELIGTVVYIKAPETNKLTSQHNLKTEGVGDPSGISKLTGKANEETKQQLKETRLQQQAETDFINTMLTVLFTRALLPIKEKPFPGITAKQFLIFLGEYFSTNGLGFHEEHLLMLLLKQANPAKTDSEIKELAEKTNHLAEGEFLEFAEKHSLDVLLKKADETMLLRLGWVFVIAHQQYKVDDTDNVLYDILRNEGKDPEKLKKEFTEKFVEDKKKVVKA